MSVEIERRFVTRIVATGEVRTASAAGVEPSWFEDDDARGAWAFIRRYYESHGKAPSMAVLRDAVAFEPVKGADDPLSGLIERMSAQALYTDVSTSMEEVRQATLDDPQVGLAKFRAESMRLSMRHATANSKWDRNDAIQGTWDRYAARAELGGMTGIPWPWAHLNEATGGIQRSDYVILHGRRKSFKSWFLLYILVNAWRTRGTSFLLVFKEMTVETIHDRICCMVAGVPWGAFRRNRFNEAEKARWALAKEEMCDLGPYSVRRIRAIGVDVVGELQGYIDADEPDVVGFDGLYLADPGRKNEVLTEVSTLIRSNIDHTGVPFIGTVQTNRKGDIGYSDAFEQDASLVLEMERDEEMARNSEVKVGSPAARDAVFAPFMVRTLPAYNFEQVRVLAEEGGGGEEEVKDDDEPDNDITKPDGGGQEETGDGGDEG